MAIAKHTPTRRKKKNDRRVRYAVIGQGYFSQIAVLPAFDEHGVKLMIAYRLHFEPANLAAVELIASGKIGETRAMTSQFAMQVAEDNIRSNPRDMGGGPLYDLGIYCINAARMLFRSEP